MSSNSNLKKMRGTFLLGSTVAGIVGTAAASASAQVPGAQETKDFLKGAYEGAKSFSSEAVKKISENWDSFKSGANNVTESLGDKISSGVSNAKEYVEGGLNRLDDLTGNYISGSAKYVGNKVSSMASTAGEYISKGLGHIDDYTGNVVSKGFNKLKNSGFGKSVSKVTSPVANFVKAHPYVSVALAVVSVLALYKLFKRSDNEVKKEDIGVWEDMSSDSETKATSEKNTKA